MYFMRILLFTSFVLRCDNDGLTTYDFLDWCNSESKDIPIDFGDPSLSHESIQVQMTANYPAGIDCTLSVIPQAKHGISITFLWLDLPRNSSCLDYIQINTGSPLCRFNSLPPGGKFFFAKSIDIHVVSHCQKGCNKVRDNFGFLAVLKSASEAHPVITDDADSPDDGDDPLSDLILTSPRTSSSSHHVPSVAPPVFRPTPRPPATSSVALYSTLILVGILITFAAICVITGYCRSNDEERRRTQGQTRLQDGGDDNGVGVSSFANPFVRTRFALHSNTPRIVVTSPDTGSRPRSTSPLRRVLARHCHLRDSGHEGLMQRDRPPPYTARNLHRTGTASEDGNCETESNNRNRHDNPRNGAIVHFATISRSDDSDDSGADAATNVGSGVTDNMADNMATTTTTAVIAIPQRSTNSNISTNVSPPCYACVENHSPVCFHQTSLPEGAPGPTNSLEPVRLTRVRIKSV